MSLEKRDFKLWDVKPVWEIRDSQNWSPTLGLGDGVAVEVWGMRRVSKSESLPLERTSSLEKNNQGFVEGVEDLRFTLFVMEQGPAVEYLRRAKAAGLFFKLGVRLLSALEGGKENYEAPWLQGYDSWEGCRITNITRNYEISEFPIMEFECLALEHIIPEASIVYGDETIEFANSITSGDGTYAREL